MKISFLVSCFSLLGALGAGAAVKLPAIFSDHLVLQRDAKVPVWGWADAGEEITVSVAGKQQSTKTGADGKWRVELEGLKAGGPHAMSVKGATEITLQDVLIGEVWLGSGQSNMAMQVNRAQDFDAEKAAANLPQIHMFTVSNGASPEPKEDCVGKWVVCTPDSVGSFSATAFFFGREIHKELKVPVGLINSSVGGTPIESWVSPEAQQASPELKAFFEAQKEAQAAIDADALKSKYEKDLAAWPDKVKQAKAEGKPAPKKPQDPVAMKERKGNVGGLFNGKIHPLIPFAIRGALWYQGEANSNGTKAMFYQYQLPLLVKDWRTRWGYEFPFAWVQLPNFTKADDGWCVVRDAELKTLSLPKTGMAITVDVGDPENIHPTNKQAVGKRLALWALGAVYGGKGETSGPLPAGHEIKGSEVVLKFSHTGNGLEAKGGELNGFRVAGEDKQWKEAKARIEGKSVIASSSEVPHPVAARYAWQDNPVCNLYNSAGLPASPFRTDDWPAQLNAAEARKSAAKVKKTAEPK